MCDHDHISLGPDNTLRPTDIGVDDPFSQGWVLDIRQIPGAKDCSLEHIRFGVVEIL